MTEEQAKDSNTTNHPLWPSFLVFLARTQDKTLWDAYEAGAVEGCRLMAKDVVRNLMMGTEYEYEAEELSKTINEAASGYADSITKQDPREKGPCKGRR